MSEALYVAEGDEFVPTDYARGPWSDDAQHGSPPCGLLARAVERVPTAVPMQAARLTVDLFRRVPMEPLRIETDVVRDGRRIQAIDARLLHGGQVVVRASALKIRTTHVSLPKRPAVDLEMLPPPREATPLDPSWWHVPADMVRFHSHAIEIRTFDDSFVAHGPGRSWLRLVCTLVDGEEPTPFVRLATLADLSNGNAQALDAREYLYVNPDITLHTYRLPEGEWIGMRSVAYQGDAGVGLADTIVVDRSGPVGRIVQAQLLERRSDDA